MELISMAAELVQSVAEYAASYKTGQVVLRQIDRALWVVEKTARWALPPPIEQEDKAQPELVRPLPWFLFLLLLITLRVVRESLSLFNLLLGKPAIRSVDVVTFIQSRRRYIRTVKYQGSRTLRARSLSTRRSVADQLHTLLAFTMCFRQPQGNNNGDERLIVKRKRNKEVPPQAAPAQEDAMERLLEKMMVDLDADSDDDSSFTLTNATSIKSDTDVTESDQETANFDLTPHSSPETSLVPSSTPKRSDLEVKPEEIVPENEHQSISKIPTPVPPKHHEKVNEKDHEKPETSNSDGASENIDSGIDSASNKSAEDSKVERNGNDSNAIDLNTLEAKEDSSFFEVNKSDICVKKESKNLIDKEKSTAQKKPSKIANGRPVETQSKRKGIFKRSFGVKNYKA